MVRAVFDLDAALEDLGQADLAHKTRTKRLLHTAGLLGLQPAGRSLPDRLPNRADYEGALNLVNNPAVTHSAILAPHFRATRARMLACPGIVLVISDRTTLDFSGLRVACLGPIGNGNGKGFDLHNSLAVDPATGDLLGLTSQIIHVHDCDEQIRAQRQARAAVPGTPADCTRPDAKPKGKRRRPDEPAAERHARQSRETRLWLEGSAALGEVPEGKTWVDVCDRASDTWEYLSFMAARKRNYVIRSKHDRSLHIEEGVEPEAEAEQALLIEEEGGSGEPRRLHEVLRGLSGVTSWQVEVSQNNGQTARTATVQMAWTWVRLKAPKSYQGQQREPLEVCAIRVWEPEPPAGVKEPLEWLLLTNVPVEDNEEARQRVGWYEWRPVVEEFHKAQKTGMGVEDLQLQSRGGLEAMVGLLSVLAVVLVNLRQQARQPEAETTCACEVVDPLWVRVLSIHTYGETRELNLRQFVLDLAKLGGYMNRRRDAWPGWLVLWRGLTKLLHMVRYESARANCPRNTPEL
jgi:hypothetical protein